MMKCHLLQGNYVQQMVMLLLFNFYVTMVVFFYIVEGQTVFYLCPKCSYVSDVYRLMGIDFFFSNLDFKNWKILNDSFLFVIVLLLFE